MKKISIAIVSLALMVGVACGGKSSWSEADKAELKQGFDMVVAMDVLTQDQADCMSDWLQDRYDSLDAANAAEGDDKVLEDLVNDCDLDPSYFESEGDEPEDISTDDSTLESMCMEAVGIITDGLTEISSGLSSPTDEFLDTSRDFIDESIDTMESCVDAMPEVADFLDSLYEVRDALQKI